MFRLVLLLQLTLYTFFWFLRIYILAQKIFYISAGLIVNFYLFWLNIDFSRFFIKWKSLAILKNSYSFKLKKLIFVFLKFNLFRLQPLLMYVQRQLAGFQLKLCLKKKKFLIFKLKNYQKFLRFFLFCNLSIFFLFINIFNRFFVGLFLKNFLFVRVLSIIFNYFKYFLIPCGNLFSLLFVKKKKLKQKIKSYSSFLNKKVKQTALAFYLINRDQNQFKFLYFRFQSNAFLFFFNVIRLSSFFKIISLNNFFSALFALVFFFRKVYAQRFLVYKKKWFLAFASKYIKNWWPRSPSNKRRFLRRLLNRRFWKYRDAFFPRMTFSFFKVKNFYWRKFNMHTRKFRWNYKKAKKKFFFRKLFLFRCKRFGTLN